MNCILTFPLKNPQQKQTNKNVGAFKNVTMYNTIINNVFVVIILIISLFTLFYIQLPN